MDIDILMSTMRQKDFSLITSAKFNSGIVVNQTDLEDSFRINDKVYWINSKSRGLSISRNIALQNSDADICVLGDDDLEYVENYNDIILTEFKGTNADIICFQVHGIEKKFKDFSSKEKRIGYLEALKISSVQIAFRREAIISNNLLFDEEFGAGTEYSMGEENIFLYDCLKKGLRIKYIPIKIADLHITESSWFQGFNMKYLRNRGAIFYRMSNSFYMILILQFAFRKKKLFEGYSYSQIIKGQLAGANEYKLKKQKG